MGGLTDRKVIVTGAQKMKTEQRRMKSDRKKPDHVRSIGHCKASKFYAKGFYKE